MVSVLAVQVESTGKAGYNSVCVPHWEVKTGDAPGGLQVRTSSKEAVPPVEWKD